MSKDITGRDGYIEGKALVYAIAAIQGLPFERQEGSDMRDMIAIARATTSPAELALLAYGTEIHMGRRVNLHTAEETKESIEYDLALDKQLIALHDMRDQNCGGQAGYVSLKPDYSPIKAA